MNTCLKEEAPASHLIDAIVAVGRYTIEIFYILKKKSYSVGVLYTHTFLFLQTYARFKIGIMVNYLSHDVNYNVFIRSYFLGGV
ncbi:hypothetical protein PY093_12380 [Cytobacillus sp. S13-E01]|uniref:hypothetical protein n=1 Tax=Cytobacillus sp. S13-E01 TaxID=3031326 RepID=UPI0023D8BEA0|nr:hypothetical protein [Cytobacillus sp. S13-E01]MDF0727485.1 hypothetical protein [Cytobacillus sp. S13-E01]